MPRVFAVTRARKHADHDQSEHGNWADGLPSIAKHSEVWKTDSYKRLTEQAKLANPEGKYPGPVESWVNGPSNSYGANAHLTIDVHVSNLELAKDVFRELGYQDKHMQVTPKLVEQGLGRDRQQVDRGLVSVRVPWAKPAKSIKHGDHDQSDHGNRDGAGVSSAPQTFSEVLSLATGTKDGGELLTKVLEARGVSMKPQLAKLTGSDRIYRGVTTDEAARSFLSGEAPIMGGYPMGDDGRLEPYTWGAGFYATTEREEAVSYRGDNGRVIEMEFSPEAKILRGELAWDQVPDMPDDWSKQEWGEFNGTISDLKNAYWASQGYDAIDLGREIVILNPAAIIADVSTAEAVGVDSGRKSPFDNKSLKHLDGEHDQGDHGSWATGITGGKKLPAAEFAAKLVARAAESRGGKSGIQQLDLSNTSSFAEIKSASDKITSAIDEEMGKWPSAYAQPRVEPTEQQKFLKQFSDGSDLMRNTLHSANEGEIGRNKDFQFFVATGVDGTTPVGTLVYRNFTAENVGNNPYLTGHEDKWVELTNIGTNGLEPGVGTRLVTQVLGAAAESGRGVWLNQPYDEAVSFYRELGFEMKYKQGDWIGYMEPETVQEWWKSYEAAGGK